MAITVSREAAFTLENLNLSIKLDTIASITDTELVIAAKSTIAKKRQPTTFPIEPIAAKTFGNETNIRLGPDASIPSVPANVNTAGIIITPASKATAVSKISI